jgi:hypothetical protein
MSVIGQVIKERVTSLKLRLLSRFARRQVDKLGAYAGTVRRLGPSSATVGQNYETLAPSAGRCLGGLEVAWSSGSSVTVSPGAMLSPTVSPVTETRPGTWSGRFEADDSLYGLAELAQTATIAASDPIPGALAGPEWWVVYVVPTETTVETDSSARVYNQVTGIFDASTRVQVTQRQLVPGIVRGAANGTIATSMAGMPANAIAVAWIYVLTGATDLSGAIIYDTRKMPDQDPGPNQIGGCWSFDTVGAQASPYNQSIFYGRAWARLGGELLSIRSSLSSVGVGVQVADIAEAGATWDNTASTSAPKLAWLYLCKPHGLVPRPVRHGNAPIGNNSSFLNDAVITDGVLVLSPTPPKLGTDLSEHRSGHRWDMRASLALSPTTFTRGQLPHAFAGATVVANDAICVGVYRYTGLTGSNLPILYGALQVDEMGWVTGGAIHSDSSVIGLGLPTSGIFASFGATATLNNGVAPRTLAHTSILLDPTILGSSACLPFDAIRVYVTGNLSTSGSPVRWTGLDNGILTLCDGSSPFSMLQVLERRARHAGSTIFAFNATLDTATFGTINVYLMGLRLPFGEALVTLPSGGRGRVGVGDHVGLGIGTCVDRAIAH